MKTLALPGNSVELAPMKLPPQCFHILLAGISCLATSTFAATEAMTDPVGFVTATAASGSVAAPKLSLVSPTLTRPVEWQGAILTISATEITVSGAPWTVGQFNGASGNFYVEIASGANSGAISDIANTPTTGSITTSDSLIAFGAVGNSIKIRKHVTLADFLGATNSAGLLATADPTTADEVLIYDGASSTAYFYYTGAPGFPAGWYDSAFALDPGEAAKVVVGPHQGVAIKRRGTTSLSITSSGSVKTGNTLLPVVNGLNVLGTVSAKGLTLATSGLYTGNLNTGIKPSSDPTTGDEVTIYTPTGQTSYFYYTGSPGFPAGWYDSAFALDPGVADSISIPPGTAFVLRRKGGVAFNWVLPSPTSF